MSGYDNLLGLDYVDGRQDCYSLCRLYYRQVWELDLPNFARPTHFWLDEHMDLYRQYQDCGFQIVVDDHHQVGDAVLMPLLSSINSHAGVIVDDNRLLHHLPNRQSAVETFRPKWADRVTVHLRHPHVTRRRRAEKTTIHLHEVIDAHVLRDPDVQREIEKQVGPEG